MARVRFNGGKKTGSGSGCLLVFGLIFAAAGGAGFFFLFIRPTLSILTAQSWVATPCVIESSSVEIHDSDDGNTYSIDVTYRYTYDGRTYRGDHYAFSDVATSGRKGKQRIVDAMPPGSAATCYVNPDAPGEAVIERGWTNDLWFGLFPLLFLGVGLAVMFAGVRQWRRRGSAVSLSAGARQVDWLPDVKHTIEGGHVVLRAQHSPLAKFLGFTFFALFWNGITSVFVVMAVKSHLDGDPEWFLTIFIIPFVLVGLVLIGVMGHQFLAMFNPKFELTLDAAEAKPGDVLQLSWRIHGAVGRLRRVRIELVGEETAQYRRGTDTVTDKHTFLEQMLYETAPDTALVNADGRCEVPIPPGAMHSFKSSNNSINWRLRVRGDVPRWPDISNEYALLITPGGA